MFFMVREWQQTGLSQKQYCQENNIQYHVFHYWYRKFRDEQPATERQPGFVQINNALAGNIPFAEFTFPGGSRVVFHQVVGVDYLKELAG